MERSLNDARTRRLSHKWQPELRAVFCDWWIIIVCQQDAWANLCTFGWFLKILVPQTSIHPPPPLNLGDSVLVGDYGCIITQLLATTVEENWGPFWHRPLEAELGPTVGSTSFLSWKWNMSWCNEGNIKKHYVTTTKERTRPIFEAMVGGKLGLLWGELLARPS